MRLLLEVMNQRIEALYDRDHTIGHAYFTSLKNLAEADRFETLQETFRNRIVPLLEEYFFDDWQKIRLVLGDNQKRDSALQFFAQTTNTSFDALFGKDHGSDDKEALQRCQIQDAALKTRCLILASTHSRKDKRAHERHYDL